MTDIDLKELTPDQLRALRAQVSDELGDTMTDVLRCPGKTERDEWGNVTVLEKCDYTHTTHAAKCPEHGISLV